MAKTNLLQIAAKKRGPLHKTPTPFKSKNITAAKLARAAKASGSLGRRQKLATTLKKMQKRS